MRMWSTTALLILCIAVAATGCSAEGTPTSGPKASVAVSASSPSRDAVCTMLTSDLVDSLDDPTQSAVQDYTTMQRNPDWFPVDQHAGIREAYFAYQAGKLRSAAAQITDDPLRDALLELANDISVSTNTDIDKPPAAVTLVSEVIRLCGGKIISIPGPAGS